MTTAILETFQVKLILAFIVGAIIGLERQFAKEISTDNVAEGPGVRSFGLISLLGASTIILEEQYGIRYMVIVGFIGLLLVVYVYLVYYIKIKEELNLTTSIAAVLAFILGIFVGVGEFYWALIISVFITAVLSIKKVVLEFLKSLEYSEITSAMQIAIIALIILPIVPPIQILGAINLQAFIVFLVFVLSVEFIGYVAVRHLGEVKGLIAFSWLGAFVHSESTAMEITRVYTNNKETFASDAAALAILSVDSSLIIRTIIFLGVLALAQPYLTLLFTLITSIALIFAISYVYLNYKKEFNIRIGQRKIFASPLSYKSAVKFATILFIVSIMIIIIRRISYELTIFFTFLGGFFSVTGIELAVVSMFLSGTISMGEALQLLSIGLIAGITNKPFFSKLAGADKSLLLRIVLYTAIVVCLVYVGYLLVSWGAIEKIFMEIIR